MKRAWRACSFERRRYETSAWTLCVILGVLFGGGVSRVKEEQFTPGMREEDFGWHTETMSLLQLRNPSHVSTGEALQSGSNSGTLQRAPGPSHASMSKAMHHDASAHTAGPIHKMSMAVYSGLLVVVAVAICVMKRAMQPEEKEAPKLYLVTTSGFVLQIFISMVIFFAAAFVASLLPAVRNDCPYHTAVQVLLEQNHGFVVSVWSLFGLVSSSCCAIQLVLNLFNIGCAGFNTVLGPWRPVFMGLTATLQTAVWAHVYMNPHMWYMAAVGTIVAISLSFLPEILHLLSLCHATPAARGELLILHVEGMGCAACSNAVLAICNADARIASAAVAFEDKRVRCELAERAEASSLADELCLRLSDAGFTARPACGEKG